MNTLARGMALAGALSAALARELRARTSKQRGGEAGEALRIRRGRRGYESNQGVSLCSFSSTLTECLEQFRICA